MNHACRHPTYIRNPRIRPIRRPPADYGTEVITVTAAVLSRFDILHASGTHMMKPPVLPAVVGNEGVGRLADGRRVYFAGPVRPFGSMAERTLAKTSALIEVPGDVDDAVGVRWAISCHC